MKCDYCDSKATVFLTQLAEGQMKKVCLCESCAEERGVTDPTGFSLADMLQGNFQKAMDSDPIQKGGETAARGSSCDQCGFTLDDFQKIRRFGCANCYTVFGHELSAMLRSMHKGPTHVGKVPEGLMESHYRNQRMQELRTKLEKAISSESYEEAADLRDEIRLLEEKEVAK